MYRTEIYHIELLFSSNQVPIGYSSPLSGNMDAIHGGSAYGAGRRSIFIDARQAIICGVLLF